MAPEALVRYGAAQSSVVMMNEAHDGYARMPRTRKLGTKLLPLFHSTGFRILALEALPPETAQEWNQTRKVRWYPNSRGYLSQPEMQTFIQSALDLGWTLVGYDVTRRQDLARLAWFAEASQNKMITFEYTQWRERKQGQNLMKYWNQLNRPKMLVWCGNGHLAEHPLNFGKKKLYTMGWQFKELSGVDPFTINQTRTADWPGEGISPTAQSLLERHNEELRELGGHGGYLTGEPPYNGNSDAIVISLDNKFE